MGRKTVYNRVVSADKLAQINPENLKLKDDFIAYLRSIQRSEGTIKGYDSDLLIVFVFLLEKCNNKPFYAVKKRDWVSLQNWLLLEHKNSAARVRRIKSAISSLGNYCVNILSEDGEPEYENYKSTIRSIESPPNDPVREKTILTEEQCQHILDRLIELGKIEQACYFALAIYSGRRKSELFRFKIEHFGEDHLIEHGALYSTISTIRTKGKGVNGKQLVCFTLAKPFHPYFQMWMDERAKLGIESEWLFPDRSDPTKHREAGIANSWANLYTRLLREVAGDNAELYLHSCRHRLCSYFSAAGVPQSVIQTYFGWSDVSLVAVYNDNPATEEFGKYFTADGIKGAEQKSLSDL